MANEKETKSGGKGQQKLHAVHRVDPATGVVTEEAEWTQEQWQNRDKTAGWVRDDGVTDDEATEGDTE